MTKEGLAAIKANLANGLYSPDDEDALVAEVERLSARRMIVTVKHTSIAWKWLMRHPYHAGEAIVIPVGDQDEVLVVDMNDPATKLAAGMMRLELVEQSAQAWPESTAPCIWLNTGTERCESCAKCKEFD